jgi:putative PIN family toxin of toxin-antitoxin system
MPPSPELRVVLDTNVLVSGLVAEGGAPHRILDAWLDGHYTLVTSLYLTEELIHVLSYPRIAKRLNLDEGELAVILTALLSQAEITPGHLRLPGVTRDPKDDAVVACAREGEADYIVSGDQDLLTLGEYEGIQVVTPRRFVEILVREE